MWAWVKAHLAATILVGLVSLALIYEVATKFIVYSWDAYVTTDIVHPSPLVPGQLHEIAVGDNEPVKAGDLLFAVDPRPYQIAVNRAEASVALEQAQLDATSEDVAASRATVDAAQARQSDASAKQSRMTALLRSSSISRQEADDAVRDLMIADADLAVARAELERARYELDMTKVVSPVDGVVAPFTARPGDFVEAGKPVLAVVSDNNWHVAANLAEDHVAVLLPGQPVHLRLAADPWTLHEGTVRSVARAVARTAEPVGVVPFVPNASEWIRLERRFPVEIDLGTLPRQRQLFAGADASVLIFLPPGGRP